MVINIHMAINIVVNKVIHMVVNMVHVYEPLLCHEHSWMSRYHSHSYPIQVTLFSHVIITLMLFFGATEPMVNMVNGFM